MKSKKRFVAYFYFVGWDCISLGLHVCARLPNAEIHLPFGFVRIGWMPARRGRRPVNYDEVTRRTFGVDLT